MKVTDTCRVVYPDKNYHSVSDEQIFTMASVKTSGWTLVTLLVLNFALTQIYAIPQHEAMYVSSEAKKNLHDSPYYTKPHLNRKFAEKPNAIKKVALDDIDDIQTNQIQDGGFSWSNMLGVLMQMMFNGGNNSPTKSDDIDNSANFPQSPWANVISVGLKIITALLGGGANDGIDKVDNGGSPMQVNHTLKCFLVFGIFW